MDLTNFDGIGGVRRFRTFCNVVLPDDDEIVFDELENINCELDITSENDIIIDETFAFDDSFTDGVDLFNDQIIEVNSDDSFVQIPIEIISSDIFLGCNFIQGDTGENSNMEIMDWISEPLFDGCTFNCQHVLLVLEYLKSIGHLGDGQESVFLGIICSILPDSNVQKDTFITLGKIKHMYNVQFAVFQMESVMKVFFIFLCATESKLYFIRT